MTKRKTQYEFLLEVNEKFNVEYTVLSEYKGAKSKIKMQHNSEDCNFHIFDAIPSNVINRGDGCTVCRYSKSSKSNSFTLEDCQNKLNLIHGENEYVILGNFKRAGEKALVKHSCSYTWNVRIDHVMNESSGCPVCSEKVRRKKKSVSLEDAQKRLDNMYGENEYVILDDFEGTTKKALVKHSCGYTWNPFINNLLKGEKVCPTVPQGQKETKRLKYF